ncbi:NTE family protein [Deinococcus metalli]|uniref:NTE family protein n=1 Tax=Deinococcus metalli TaxID=1141878 RepID=A0A7W8NTU1_9DEIO|nr:patatin-like phospholipase family protein [Deinococcus metalli]MBB5378577.1 NTE family protein [Deinococcus metalli]GHF58747.1 patatin [Deinococcus metalli]
MSDLAHDTARLATTPAARQGRTGTGLCLSGGGYRAALFHLGAVRRMHELDLLEDLRTVSSVSGGSILAARMAQLPWSTGTAISPQGFQNVLAEPTYRQADRDIRTYPIVRRLMPWNWRGPTAIHGVSDLLDDYCGHLKVHELPQVPNFVFCATDLTHGTNWIFSQDRIGGHKAGYAKSWRLDLPLSLAVATSACFPPVFAPVELALSPKKGKVLLNDGGNYDNLGLEPVWKSHELVFVSDGGTPFQYGVKSGLIGHLTRFITILDTQSRSLRKRWLMASDSQHTLTAVYWSVGRSVHTYRKYLPADAECLTLGYSQELARRIGLIRTDFNRFSEGEQAVLENHGYLLADAALQAFLPAGSRPHSWPALHVPHSAWLDPNLVDQVVPTEQRVQ